MVLVVERKLVVVVVVDLVGNIAVVVVVDNIVVVADLVDNIAVVVVDNLFVVVGVVVDIDNFELVEGHLGVDTVIKDR